MGFPLSDAEHAAIKAQIEALPELIVAAAVRVDGRVVMVERPGRHGDCINWLHHVGKPHRAHGFVTSRGRFVERLEAAELAVAAGQATPREGCNGFLFSEDVWNDWDKFPVLCSKWDKGGITALHLPAFAIKCDALAGEPKCRKYRRTEGSSSMEFATKRCRIAPSAGRIGQCGSVPKIYGWWRASLRRSSSCPYLGSGSSRSQTRWASIGNRPNERAL